jgi:hypothetical protein
MAIHNPQQWELELRQTLIAKRNTLQEERQKQANEEERKELEMLYKLIKKYPHVPPKNNA